MRVQFPSSPKKGKKEKNLGLARLIINFKVASNRKVFKVIINSIIYMDVKQFRGNTEDFLPFLGPLLKHVRARNSRKRIDLSQLSANSANVVGGHNVYWDNFPYSICGTVEGRLDYLSPENIVTAYTDLKKLGKQTGMDFTRDMRAIPDLDLFVGQWYVSNHRQIEKGVDLVDSEICFPGLITSNSERTKLHGLVDKVYEPKLEGDGYYWTGHEGNSIGSYTPTIQVKKTWQEFDEREVMDFFERIKSFEKPQYKIHSTHDSRMTLRVRSPTQEGNELISASYFFPRIDFGRF